MDVFESLTEHFKKFPGIGPRQAKRFAYYLLARDANTLKNLSELILAIKKETMICTNCFRFFAKKKSPLCPICTNETRDHGLLMIVAHDVDIDAIEKSGSYTGYYFVLGGNLPILEKNPDEYIRSKELLRKVKGNQKIKEVILALDVNPEGEYTLEYITKILEPFSKAGALNVTHLGRGLSTGTELEYSDTETIKNALKGRVS